MRFKIVRKDGKSGVEGGHEPANERACRRVFTGGIFVYRSFPGMDRDSNQGSICKYFNPNQKD
jgi:hypothetical protein